MPMKGYDVFFTGPDTAAQMRCRVCGTACTVERSLHGPTGWVEALGKSGDWHDKFSCPHRDEPWHERALELFMHIEETPSPRLAALMRQDLADLLNEHGCEPGEEGSDEQ